MSRPSSASSARRPPSLVPRGQVKINGEIWEARATRNARAGETVRVTRVDGLMLEVEPAEAP